MTARTDYTTDEVMFDAFAQPHGNCKPSGFSEFDNLSGYVVYSRTVEGITLDGWHVRHTVEYVNLGRPDRGTPVDPDAEMQPERMEKYNADALSLRVRKAKTSQRHHALCAILAAHMRDRGPLLVRDVATILGTNKELARQHLQRFEDTFYVRLPVNKQRDLWGLMDIHQPKQEATS